MSLNNIYMILKQGKIMKKSLSTIVITSTLILGLVGCGGEAPAPSSKQTGMKKAQYGKGSLVAYAYMEDGNKLIGIGDSKNNKKYNNVETILITTRGFAPSYNFNPKGQECGRYYQNKKLRDWTETPFCKSSYTTAGTGDMIGNTVWNTLLVPIAAVANPVSTASGKPLYKSTKSFNKEKFLEIVEENKLPELREKLLKLKSIAESKTLEVQEMYEPYFKKYNDNLSNIELVYNIDDKSKLFPAKKLDGDYRVVLNAPDKKKYNYSSIVSSFSATFENFDNQYADAINKINHQFEEDKKEYKLYLETAFSNYKVEGPKSKIFKHNENISFNSVIKAPSEIKYKLNQAIKIPITIVVTSAKLKNMIPKDFALDDSNMDIKFKSNADATISVIATNKTNSFVTAKSLTSYFNKDVYNMAQIDREIAPQSSTLSSNSNYTLLSDDMINSSNFEEVTKTKAKSIKTTYGYAVKYRINNTNVDESMYSTKKYSLYDIFKQYI